MRLKLRTRFTIRALLIVLVFVIASYTISRRSGPRGRELSQSVPDGQSSWMLERRLKIDDCVEDEEDDDDSFWGDYPEGLLSEDATKNGGVILYIIGSLYMFVALSISCDSYFVPALERIVEVFEISDEVAGATLMAAGGSAPELFTSFIGTFTDSSVGFGTIVGSAVFNVLFVIGMCAIFSPKGKPLELTWWPLFRDSLYYALGLLALAVFFGLNNRKEDNDGDCEYDFEIEWYEALILFIMYGGYVAIMAYNQQIKALVEGCVAGARSSKSDDLISTETPVVNTLANSSQSTEGKTTSLELGGMKAAGGALDASISDAPQVAKRIKFRVGFLDLLISEKTPDWAGIYLVTGIDGDMAHTFEIISKSHKPDEYVDKDEMKTLLTKLHDGKEPTDKEVNAVFDEVDKDKDNRISASEFSQWYYNSMHLLMAQVNRKFNMTDETKNGFIPVDQIPVLLKRLGVVPLEPAVALCRKEVKTSMHGEPPHPQTEEVQKEIFLDWYVRSEYIHVHRARNVHEHDKVKVDGADDDEDDGPVDLSWPSGPLKQVLYVMLAPLTYSLYYTLPDVRRDGWQNWYFASFFGAIMWIGVYSYLMVWWISITGNSFNIPPEVMGLTFLAAGTSIPDLLSSVIVARKGLGDMAVSSSIGSNIFDILVGLPVPWLCKCIYNAANGDDPWVIVTADTLFFSILILFGMIASVIGVVMLQGWKLTKCLGYTMFVLYAVFVAQDLMRNPCIASFAPGDCDD